MLYISVQPAEPYFLWQLEIQLQNFRVLGIPAENIQVLLGYKESDGLPTLFDHLEKRNFARFYYYTDTRKGAQYLSSIRPHILKKHFERFPQLAGDTFFYHDSDIIFRKRIDEKRLSLGETWYLSNTQNYLSAHYLKSFGNGLFEGLCNLVKIDPQLVEKNVRHTGGAQYVMKGVNSLYWQDVERDCELIFDFLNKYNAVHKGNLKVQAWCADMWAVLWNAWNRGTITQLSDELDFCWPKDHISRWYNTKILHNSGVLPRDKDNFFCKHLYRSTRPYFVDFSNLKSNTCSTILVQELEKASQISVREPLRDLTIILHVKYFSNQTQERTETYLRYLNKHLVANIMLLENGDWPRINKHKILGLSSYRFIAEKSWGIFVAKVTTRYLFYIDVSILLPIKNIILSYQLGLLNEKIFVQPYNTINECSPIHYASFKERLDIPLSQELIQQYGGDCYAECFLVSKDIYVKSGGENLAWSYYLNDGFNLERESRLRLLGVKIIRLDRSALKVMHSRELKKGEEGHNLEKREYDRRIVNGDVDYIRKELSLLNYSHRRIYGRQKKFAKNNIFKIYAMTTRPHLNSIINEFDDKNEFDLKVFKAVGSEESNLALWQSIILTIEQHNFNEQDFIIVCLDNISFTTAYSKDRLNKSISDMRRLGLEIVCGGGTGEFFKTHRLTNELVLVDGWLSAQFIILSRSICRKILAKNYTSAKTVEAELDELTKFKAILVPFIAVQKSSDSDNGDYVNRLGRRFKLTEEALRYQDRE